MQKWSKKKIYLPTLEETFGSHGLKFVLGYNNSSMHETIASATIVIFLREFLQCCEKKINYKRLKPYVN